MTRQQANAGRRRAGKTAYAASAAGQEAAAANSVAMAHAAGFVDENGAAYQSGGGVRRGQYVNVANYSFTFSDPQQMKAFVSGQLDEQFGYAAG